MNKPYTVNQLKRLCEEQIKKGNGNKIIMISDDEEGNGFHYLWQSFTEIEDEYYDLEFDKNISNKENTIILG